MLRLQEICLNDRVYKDYEGF